MTDGVAKHFDEIAPEYDQWKEKAHYYYSTVKALLAETVPPGRRVCEVGCGTGDVLASLRPADGLGTDVSEKMIELAARRHPDLRFKVHDLMNDPLSERFEYIVSVDVAEHVPDLDKAMATMAGMMESDGRLVLLTANPKWRIPLEAAERLSMKMPEGEHQWRSRDDLERAAAGAGLREVFFSRSFVVPKAIPGLKKLNTWPRAERLRARYGLIQRAVFELAHDRGRE